MKRRTQRKTIYFMESGQEYLLAYVLAFTYGGVLMGYWVFPFMIIFHILISSAKKKDPEFLKVFIKGIKVKTLVGEISPVDITAPPDKLPLNSFPKHRKTILTLISSIRTKKPLTDIALLKGGRT